MSRTERLSFWLLTIVCAATRPLAMARSPWAWDEMLFTSAVRAYDVTQHHPHPPGYPLFIVLGKVARLTVRDDFRALQTVNLIAGALLFPAVFLLARELQLRFETAAIAATLCAFLPTVWFYGGTAFSDVTSIVIVVFAAALLIRATNRSVLAGSFLLGCAIAVRPQNLLIGLAPLIVAMWRMTRPSSGPSTRFARSGPPSPRSGGARGNNASSSPSPDLLAKWD